MRLILHLGAHGTDDGLIGRWLDRNRGPLEAQGIAVPRPRSVLSDMTEALDVGRNSDPHLREETLLRGWGASGARRWMAISAPGLLGTASDAVAPEGFYTRDVARRLYALGTLFPRCQITLMLGIRTASGILPDILPKDPALQADAMPILESETLPWARLVAAMRRHLPAARVVVWRHEDVPTLWPAVLAQIVGPGRVLPPTGLAEFAALGLSAEARVRLTRYLAANPPATAGHLRKTAAAFAARYGVAASGGATADLPAWAQSEIARMDRGYETEWSDICGMPGVTALT